jgi:diketogulonate reductase-like aldo/keto reductase
METLIAQGKIRRWGVSNLDYADMQELWRVQGGKACVTDQVLYHLGSRGIEYDLLPWCQNNRCR